MKKNIITIAITLFCIVSCTNPVEKADKHFTKEIPNKLSAEIEFFSKTIKFYEYAVPANYWYPKDYTYGQIIEDKLRFADTKLKKLDKEISAIPPYNKRISYIIKVLKKDIKKNRVEYNKIQKEMSTISPVLLSFYSNLSTGISKGKAHHMPEDIKQGIIDLQKEIKTIYSQNLPSKLFDFEYLFLKSNNINDKETRAKIREIAKQVMRKNLLADSTNIDMVYASEIINSIYEKIPNKSK